MEPTAQHFVETMCAQDENCSVFNLFLRSNAYVSEEPFEHPSLISPSKMIHGHCSLSELQTRKKTTDLQGSQRAKGHDYGNG